MPDSPIALVTGANGNLGRAVVQRLATSGQSVARVEHGKLLLADEAISDIDLASGPSVRAAFAALTRRGHRLEAVVHTVGAFRFSGPLGDVADADFVELFQTNVMTTVHVMQ